MKTKYKRVTNPATFQPMIEVTYYIPMEISEGKEDDPAIFDKIGKEIMYGAGQYLKDNPAGYGMWSEDDYNFRIAK